MDTEIDNYPFKLSLDNDTLQSIVEKSKDWCLMHGVAIRPSNNMDANTLTVAPHVLWPSPVPRKDFEELTQLQPALNMLMHNVAHDHSFLEESLKTTIQCDEFTRKLYEIYSTVRKEGFAQDVSLGMLRNDVIFSEEGGPKQVEINSIASGLAHLGPILRDVHSYILAEMGYEKLLQNMPENNALNLMCQGIVKAWEYYAVDNAVVIFLVEDVTSNICDQRFMEYEVRRIQPKIKVLRVKFSDPSNFKLGNQKQLLVNGQEVAVVYYRVGYSPDQYSDSEWQTRLLIERSKAIKCPSIQYHLAGTKKIQQVLARPNILEKFVHNPIEIKAIRKLFTEIHSLDLNEEGDKVYNLAMTSPQNYVLKPQREGGGNNIYGEDIPKFLSALGEERQAYILMGLISPKPTKNYLISKTAGEVPPLMSLVSEFGVYGVIIGSSKEILTNYQAGHMLRSKLSTSNEGGVAVGSGFLDSPYLT